MLEKLRIFLFLQTLPKIVPLILSRHEFKIMSLTKKGSDHYVLDKLIYKFFEYPTFDLEKNIVSSELRKFLERFNFNDRKIVLLIPELSILQDLIKYDGAFIKKRNINEFLANELLKRFPFKIDELLYDYNIDEGKEGTEFVVAAVPRREVQNFIDIFNNLRASQIVLPLITEEIIRALKPIIHIDKNYLLIIIEFSYVTIVIIEKGRIIIIHRLRQKIIDLINYLKKVLNLTTDYIIETFLTIGIEERFHKNIENLQLQKTLLEFIEELRGEASKLLNYYSANRALKVQLDEIFLVGKFGAIKGLKEYFESNYQTKVVVPDPFEINNINTNISLGAEVKKSITETPWAFIDAVGLALRCMGPAPEENGINLIIRSQ